MKATIKEGCLTHWFSYSPIYFHVPFPSISSIMWKIAWAMRQMLKISTFNPPSPSRLSWKHTMRRQGDAASKVRWFSENKHEN